MYRKGDVTRARRRRFLPCETDQACFQGARARVSIFQPIIPEPHLTLSHGVDEEKGIFTERL